MNRSSRSLLQRVTLLALLCSFEESLALSNNGASGTPSSLVLTVYDPETQNTFYRDLGITHDRFLLQPSVTLNLASDSSYSNFLGKTNLLFNVASHSILKSDQSNAASWGVLLSSATSNGIFARDWVGIDSVRQTVQIYFSYLTESSGVIAAGNPGAFNSNQWNASLWGMVAGNTTGAIGAPLSFYFINNPTGIVAEGLIRKAGDWMLTSDGALSFKGSGSLLQNQPPIANAGGKSISLGGKAFTLNGSRSTDPDESPAPINYQWIQTEGPKVELNNPNSSNPSFTSNEAGLYAFSLIVSDGEDASQDTAQVLLKYLILKAPSSIKVGTTVSISWQSNPTSIDETQRIKLSFAADGVNYKPVRTGKVSQHHMKLRAHRSMISSHGSLKICSGSTSSQVMVCDQATTAIIP